MILKEDKWSEFGYYTVGSNPTPIYNLTLALEQNLKLKSTIRFRFHETIFEAANPKIEPVDSLLDLYSRRVRQLRDNYDYLVLLYSGGADSHNILKCFEYTDTKLDEIVSFVDSSYKSRDSKISSEIYQVAVPEVSEYLEKYPECKYTLAECRDVQNKLFRDSDFDFDIYYDLGYHFTPFSIMHFYGLQYEDRFHKLHNQGKKVAVIQGIDKPKLLNVAGKWAFCFSDWSSHFGHKHYLREFPFYDEFFYWTSSMPEIPIKQAHVMGRYLDYLDSIGANHPYRDNEAANVLIRKSGKKTNWEYVNHIIYPFWKTGTFSTGKTSESYIINGRDDTLARSKDELITLYKHGVYQKLLLAKLNGRGMTQLQSDYNAEDKRSIIGITPLYSRLYYIQD
jgi:hypothetical protein